MSSEWSSLCSLMLARRGDDHPVAFDPSGDRTWAGFRGDVASLRDRLHARGGRRWLVFSDDSYSFAVALMAVAHAGGIAVLPANGRPGTLSRLAADVDGLVVDRPGELDPSSRVRALEPLPVAGDAVDTVAVDSELDRDAPFVEFFTSGTTGEGRRIAKALRHLDDEIAVLERVFGEGLRPCGSVPVRILAGVSHQHIYGALFRVLWPLAAGRQFSAGTYLHGSEVAVRLAQAPAALVSTPVQLKAMAASEALAGLSLAAVFSSGAPLDEATAVAITEMVGVAPIEVYGSTESGGVAWRQRPRGGDVEWRPLPGVDIDCGESSVLVVRSPFVGTGATNGVGGDGGLAMGDRVELVAGGGFRLLGRVDRIVKIGSNRLSLAEMESEIERHPYVAEAGLTLQRVGPEERVCAAVALSSEGCAALVEMGKPGLRGQLAGALEAYFDRVLLPRAWRFVDRLPRDAQGKLPAAALRALFSSDRDSPVREPVIESETLSGRVIERRCLVPDDLDYFDGHFESFAVVPGVVQLRWVVQATQVILGTPARVSAVEALKFRRPLNPGSRFDLRVEVDDASAKVRFRVTRDGDELSSGRLTLC